MIIVMILPAKNRFYESKGHILFGQGAIPKWSWKKLRGGPGLVPYQGVQIAEVRLQHMLGKTKLT